MKFVATLLLVGIAGVLGQKKGIEISSATRKYDVSSAKVTLLEELEFSNSGNSPVSSVTICKRTPSVGALAYFRVVEGSYKRSAKSLETRPAPDKSPASVSCVSADLPAPLSAGASTKLSVYSVLIRALTPVPENVTQADMPKVVFHGDAALATPYRVLTQTTSVKTASDGLEAYGADAPDLSATKSGDRVSYGPFTSLQGFVSKPFTIHEHFPKALPRVTRLLKEVTVSPWGNIYVDEEYDLTNSGAKLLGPFSRLRHMVSNTKLAMGQSMPPDASRAAVDLLTARLPKESRGAYFRDDIGNISSSNTKLKVTETEITLVPRFPVYGGWRSVFKFGYALPYKGYLSRGEGGVQKLRVQFGSPIVEALVDDFELRIVLPEGSTPLLSSAKNIHDAAVTLESKTTYLDLKARPVVVLRRADVVPDHNLFFTIEYAYPSYRMLQAPATVLGALLVVAGSTVMLSRLSSLSISQGDAGYQARQREEKAATLRGEMAEAIATGLRALDDLETDLRLMGDKASAALPSIRAHRLAREKARAEVEAAVKAIAARAGPVDGGLREDMERLGRQLKSLLATSADLIRTLCDEGKSDMLRVGKTLVDSEKGRKALLVDAEAILGDALN